MSELNRVLLVASIYRYVIVAVGFGCVCLGYRLFRLGYFEKAGELRATYGGNHFLLKQVSPGVFFAALGAGIIWLAVYRPVSVAVPVSTATAAPVSTTTAPGPPMPCPTSEERVTGQGRKSAKKEHSLQDAGEFETVKDH
jgi:hypothetical protein